MPETRIVPARHVEGLQKRIAERMREADGFIERHASGTLRKNKRLGMAWIHQYLHERIAWEFGWVFEHAPANEVTLSDAETEGDIKALTEAGWHIERYIELSVIEEDVFETKYIRYGNREGVGIVVRQTSAPFLPEGCLVFGIVAERRDGEWQEAVNPR